MPLSAAAINKIKPNAKLQKLFDGDGLILFITPTGGKWWRFRYFLNGKENLLSLGTYPEVSLLKAREKRDAARKLVADGIDPSLDRQLTKAGKIEDSQYTFESVAREWIEKNTARWSASHKSKIANRLENNVYPWFKNRPIREMKAVEFLECLRKIELRGARETAHRTLENSGAVFRYAVATGKVDRDITPDLRGALAPAKRKHLASIKDPRAIGELLKAINGYQGSFITLCALKLAPLFFVRPGELRQGEWKDFDFESKEWRIPAERMKMKEPHIVPLSKQAVKILKELKKLTGNGKYLFPGSHNRDRPMSDGTINAALRRMDYDTAEEMTGHGFRSMASTLLNENNWNRDAIERQLAHAEGNKVRRAYNYAEFLPERRKMMQWWADYLDKLSAGKKATG